MKVNQIVNEHKKGVRAHIYNKKATTKAQGTVPLYGPDKQEAKMTPYKPKKLDENPEELKISPAPANMQQATDATGKVIAQGPADQMAQVAQAAKSGVDFTPNSPDDLKTEAGGEVLAQVNTKVNPPMVMDSATGSPLSATKTGEEITPELIARSQPDWQERSIQANGKTYPALYSGTRGYRVGKQAYQEIISGGVKEVQSPYPSRNPGTPAADAAAQAATQPPKQHQSVMPSRNAIQEADNILLDKMLTIAGLR